MDADDPEYPELREYVVGEYMSYARYVASRFRSRGEHQADLEQVAYLGLVKAVDNFDPAYETAFLTYATPVIAGEVKRHFRDTTWAVHVTRHMQELSAEIRTAEAELAQKQGSLPSVIDVARHLDVPPEEIAEAYDAGAAYSVASLDVPVALSDGQGSALGDLLGEDDPGLEKVVDRESLKPLLAELSPRDKRILLMRYFRNMTQTEIGEEIGVSQMQVSRLLAQIVGHLRTKLGLPD